MTPASIAATAVLLSLPSRQSLPNSGFTAAGSGSWSAGNAIGRDWLPRSRGQAWASRYWAGISSVRGSKKSQALMAAQAV